MGRLAFVTGATGFVGRHLVDQLISHAWRVRALVRPGSDTRHLERPGIELCTGNLSDYASLVAGMESVDAVYHLAAATAARSESEYRRANAEGTRSLVGAMRTMQHRPRRLVYLSSYAAGGPALVGQARSCSAEPAPLTTYGRTKLAGEYGVWEAEGHGVEVVVIRAPAVYGPGDRSLLPYFRLVRWHLAPLPGGEDRKLHLIFAPDLALALRRAATAPSGTYAVAEPVEHGWEDVIGAIASGLQRRPIRVRLAAPLVRTAAAISEAIGRLFGRAVPLNREKAEEMLAPAWICDLAGSEVLLPPGDVTPLQEGIDRTIHWYTRQGWL